MVISVQFTGTPYPGLRPFRYDESDVFFGRENQADQLLGRLARNRFLAITGPSGCGKSSLIRAGMIPALRSGFMAEVGSRWRICILRPGASPLRRLAQVLASPDILGADEGDAARVEAVLRRGPLGLIEVVRGAETLRGTALLVLVDQFEEIFRYRERIAADEADAFVSLLLASTRQTEVSIYVVITMRSDYLGECAVFHGLAEAVSNSQYLTPRLKRDELELAITGPARVFGGQIEPKLLNRLLNDFGMAQDQLPLLQHALARLWSRCSASAPAPVLTVSDYESIGGLAEALSNHGDEILAELKPEQQRIAQTMFRRLSGSEDGKQDVRCPARVSEVAEIAGVSAAEVTTVAEAFLRRDRCFLATPEGPLGEDTILDISHESLIRQWRKLAGWVADEARSAEMYRRLTDWALRWEQGSAELWRGPDLASALQWREREAPTPEWARRYGDCRRFQSAMKFLEASEEARRVAAATATERRQRQVRRLQRAVLGLGITTASLTAAILVYWVMAVREHDTYYKSYVDRWDEPHGVGAPLSASEVRHHSASYKITRRGLYGPVVHMELVNEQGQPRDKVGTLDAMFDPSEGTANRESRWDYVYGADGRIAYKAALDRRGKRIESWVFPPAAPGLMQSRYAYRTGGDGSLAPERGSCAAYYIYDYSPEGYMTQVHYLDQAGNPTPGKKGAFITAYEYDRQGHSLGAISLWRDGRPMNDTDGNAWSRSSYDAAGNEVSSENFDAGGHPIDAGKMGWQRFICEFDDRGNCVKPTMWHADGRHYSIGNGGNIGAGLCRSSELHYDDLGNTAEIACLMPDGHPARSGYAFSRQSYDEHGWLIREDYLDRLGHPAQGPLDGVSATFGHDDNGNITELSFFDDGGKPATNFAGWHKKLSTFENGNEIRTEFQDGDGKSVAIEGGFAGTERKFDAHGNKNRMAYLGVDGAPILNRNEGFAIKNTSLDACGREVASEFLDEKGNPVRSKNGYAHIGKVYDEDNEVAEEDYLDEIGRPTRSADGYARILRRFDRNRNVTDERYFDEQGKPLLLKGGYAEHVADYSDHNALVREAFVGTDGAPTLSEHGWASQTRRYDSHDALIEEAYFGVKGEPVLNDEGYAKASYTNDIHGWRLETTYFGPDNRPVAAKHLYAKEVDRRDAEGRLTDVSYFATDDTPAVSDAGIARETTDYDEFGRVIGWAYFGVHDEPVMGITERYHRARLVLDERGNRLEISLFGTDERPMVSTAGFAKRTDRYDGRNSVVEEAYFGVDGKPALIEDGYARITFVRDPHGADLETVYFGIDGRPVMLKQGFAKVVRNYDDYGDLVTEAYFDADGQPALKNNEFARLVRINDRHGRLMEANYYGLNGKPTGSNDLGAPRFTISYGPGDQISERLLYHENGLLEHQRLQDTNPFGSAIETTVTDLTGKTADGPDGYAQCNFGKQSQCVNSAGDTVIEAAMIVEVATNSPAERELRKGDILVTNPQASAEGTATEVGKAEERTLIIIRDGHREMVRVPSGTLGIRTRKFFVPPAILSSQ